MQRVIAYGALALLAAGGLTQSWAQPAPPGPPKEERKTPEPAHAARPEVAHPQAARPATHPEAARPEAARPEARRPEAAPARPAPQRQPVRSQPSPSYHHQAASPSRPAQQQYRQNEHPQYQGGQPQRYRIGNYNPPQGYYRRSWSPGIELPPLFRAETYWIGAYAAYGLTPPEPGAHWVRVDDDALLVEDDTGRILAVRQGIFY